jgi:hypothetical protein
MLQQLRRHREPLRHLPHPGEVHAVSVTRWRNCARPADVAPEPRHRGGQTPRRQCGFEPAPKPVGPSGVLRMWNACLGGHGGGVVGGVEDRWFLVELHATRPAGDEAEGMSRALRLAVGRLQTVDSTGAVTGRGGGAPHRIRPVLPPRRRSDRRGPGLQDRRTVAGTRPGGRRPAARCAPAPGVPCRSALETAPCPRTGPPALASGTTRLPAAPPHPHEDPKYCNGGTGRPHRWWRPGSAPDSWGCPSTGC